LPDLFQESHKFDRLAFGRAVFFLLLSGLTNRQQPQPLLQPHPQSEALATPLLQPQPVSQSRRMMIRKMHQLFEQPIVLPPLQLLRKSAAVLGEHRFHQYIMTRRI
jgi:hypothetical protein